MERREWKEESGKKSRKEGKREKGEGKEWKRERRSEGSCNMVLMPSLKSVISTTMQVSLVPTLHDMGGRPGVNQIPQ